MRRLPGTRTIACPRERSASIACSGVLVVTEKPSTSSAAFTAADSPMSRSAALTRAILCARGAQGSGRGSGARSSPDSWPNNEQGCGRVLLSKVLPIPAVGDTFRTQVVDGTAGLLAGDDAAYTC